VKQSASQTRSIGVSTIGILASLGAGSFAFADPLPNEQLKFYQSPLNDGPPGVYPVGASPLPTDTPEPFPGQDVLSTAYYNAASGVAQGTIVADDFSDSNPLPIGHVTFWGSYMNGTNASGANPVTAFQISLYTDQPASLGTGQDFSRPETLIATQTVTQALSLSYSSGTFTATPVAPGTSGKVPPPPGDSGLIEYNAELNWQNITFPDATNGNVEWLSIMALVPSSSTTPIDWGWHDRDYGIADPYAPAGDETSPAPYHFLDDAISAGYNGSPYTVGPFTPLNYNPQFDGVNSSMDMAFALYTIPTSVPEPATLGLFCLTAPAVLMRRRKRLST
jgi:hypothetical protein